MKCRFGHTLLLFLLVTIKTEGQEFFISAGDSILSVNPTLNGCTYRSLIAVAKGPGNFADDFKTNILP